MAQTQCLYSRGEPATFCFLSVDQHSAELLLKLPDCFELLLPVKMITKSHGDPRQFLSITPAHLKRLRWASTTAVLIYRGGNCWGELLMSSFLGIRPENFLGTIFDQVYIAVVVIDEQHRIVYANDQAVRILGIPRPALGSALRFEDLLGECRYFDWDGNEIPAERLPVLRVLAGETIGPHNMKLMFPGGSSTWLHVVTSRFSVMGLAGALIVATDETREVELQRVAASVQRVEVLSRLAAALAHNFNNTIQMINLNAFACLHDPDIGPGARVKLQTISDACQHASDLIKRLAQFSRAQKLELTPASVNHSIRQLVSLIEPLVINNINVVTNLDPDLPDVKIDPVEMQQVFLNLMLNASDAMPQGGQLIVATDLQDRPSEASISSEDKQCVTITISDTGSGIPEGIVQHIFEPFFTTKPTGTGLGLASAQGIVRQHGGDITVQSTVGKGTKFTIYLPPCRRSAPIADSGAASEKR